MKSDNIRRALFLFPTDQMGGAERVTLMLAEAALASGRFEEVTFFVLSKPSSGTLDSLTRLPGTRVIYTGKSRELFGILDLLRVLISAHFELVFSSHTHLNAFASLTRKLNLLRTRRLITRESTLIFERQLGWKGGIIRGLYRFYGGQDLIVCQTQRMAESLAHNTKSRFKSITIVQPNPIDLRSIEIARMQRAPQLDRVPAAAFKIVWCGRLLPVKSPLRAIETLAGLHRLGHNNAHLVMIGDGPMRDQIASHAEKLGIASHLTMAGYHPAPAALMQHCQVGLMTSDVEGFPNVILEMLAAGVPRIVTTDCAGGLYEIPSVSITRLHAAESLAQMIIKENKNHAAENVKKYLCNLSPVAFFNNLLKY